MDNEERINEDAELYMDKDGNLVTKAEAQEIEEFNKNVAELESENARLLKILAEREVLEKKVGQVPAPVAQPIVQAAPAPLVQTPIIQNFYNQMPSSPQEIPRNVEPKRRGFMSFVFGSFGWFIVMSITLSVILSLLTN